MPQRILQFDGLRALAFLMVVMHHLGVAPLGWTGVDIFFVLSGFLITSILRKRRTEPNPLRHFYAKRVRRILPPYLICLAFSLVFLSIAWRHVWPFYALPLENLATLYHLPQIGELGLAPLWSLAIEEQFYLVWPLLVLTLRRETLLYILGAIVILSPIARMVATPFTSSFWFCYIVTPLRLDTISTGALLALLCERPEVYARLKRYAPPVFFAAAVVLVFANHLGYSLRSNTTLFNALGYTVVAAMSAGLVMWATIGQGLLYRVLTVAPLRYIGTISYMAYLIHGPMMLLAHRLGDPRHIPHLGLVSIPFTLLFSSITWYLVERPILNWNHATTVALPVTSPS